ncbi:MKL/myocardin-like protein 2 [Platysternon megacephalum]|uniref:MKL/myocardin-like protein 2 n=1 Tax=Platysternon megacephalum TaxID=55544 RepID=A0A4D9EFY4_9SAUR|nr:MKL/myocardin-like protein 2 [Platysternon megacephalum]
MSLNDRMHRGRNVHQIVRQKKLHLKSPGRARRGNPRWAVAENIRSSAAITGRKRVTQACPNRSRAALPRVQWGCSRVSPVNEGEGLRRVCLRSALNPRAGRNWSC